MKKLLILSVILLSAAALRADGLMMPTTPDYPRDFLRNRMTRVTIRIRGLVAETFVYQEFVNESDKPADAMYSFPLPPEARATEFLYWYDGKIFTARLKVKEQGTNPGTGEGGIAAEVNDYIGRNGIKIPLQGIPAGGIQAVQLRYISVCTYDRGRCSIRIPLDTEDLVDTPLEHLAVSVDVHSNTPVTAVGMPTHPEFRVLESAGGRVRLQMDRPKAYTDHDLEFWYETDVTRLGSDFYSVLDDTTAGHFALFVRPPDEAEPDSVFPRRVFFLFNNSSRMTGTRLRQYATAVSVGIDMLSEADEFNVIRFNYSAVPCWGAPVPATAGNREAAKSFLVSAGAEWGSQMDTAIRTAFGQMPDENRINCIVAFTDGYSILDPAEMERENIRKAGIFPVGLGADVSRAVLEMTAALNYGFTTYFDEWDENLMPGMEQLFRKISRPIVKDVSMEFGRADLTELVPVKMPAVFAGSYFWMAGEYAMPGTSTLSMAGTSASGLVTYDFRLEYSGRTDTLLFAARLWAKETMDMIERRIELTGETPELRSRLIELSLKYNIRCRYTAYTVDYLTEWTDAEHSAVRGGRTERPIPETCFVSAYPNPCNPSATVRFVLSRLSAGEKVKFIRIYNLLGELVAVIDISGLDAGFHAIRFDGVDFRGNPLPSGVYILRLECGRETHSMRITLVR